MTQTSYCTVEGCNNPSDAQGFCCSHYGRWKRHGDPLKGSFYRVYGSGVAGVDRFWQRVNKNGPIQSHMSTCCWEWTGRPDNEDGYGRVTIDGERWGVHRYAYFLATGEDPKSLHVCHECDNPSCVRPDHLFVGTALDNQQDKVAKGRSLVGEKHPRAKATETMVREIRERRNEGASALAKAYQMNRSTVRSILDGTTWKHIT